MKLVYNKRNVKLHCTQKNLNMFIQHNAQMDKIQKNLEAYLEIKRVEFPRFYFLSNDELLQILSLGSDVK